MHPTFFDITIEEIQKDKHSSVIKHDCRKCFTYLQLLLSCNLPFQYMYSHARFPIRSHSLYDEEGPACIGPRGLGSQRIL